MTPHTESTRRLSAVSSRLHCYRKLPQAAAILLALMLPALPAVAQQSVPHPDLIVARPVVNMYRNATANSDVVSQAIYGTGVTELATQTGWYHIRTADNYTGWVFADAVKVLHGSTYAPAGEEIQVAELSANIYRDPDVTRHAPVLRLPWEARLQLAPDQRPAKPAAGFTCNSSTAQPHGCSAAT